MDKNNETITTIKPWLGGFNQYSLYITVPSKIVKKLGITQDSILYIKVIDDSIIVMKKHDPQLTKAEINRVMSHQDNPIDKPITIKEKEPDNEEFVNPLKDLNL